MSRILVPYHLDEHLPDLRIPLDADESIRVDLPDGDPWHRMATLYDVAAERIADPTADNTHEVAQRVDPASRIVYVDHDPLVLVHARALLVSTPEGSTDYVDSDVREPEKVLAEAARTLDFDQPIALMLLGVMGNVLDDDHAYSIMDRLLAAVPSGSYLVFEDGTNMVSPEAAAEAERLRAEAGDPYRLRSPEQAAVFFRDLELLEPGIVSVSQWRPEPDLAGPPPLVDALGAVGRKA